MTKSPWHWREKPLRRFLAAAQRGDLAAIFDAPPGQDASAVLDGAADREWKHGWERLIAIYVASGLGVPGADAVALNYAENRYFRYDDEGYTQQRLDVDLGMLYGIDRLGLRDPERAFAAWESALHGPYPEGAQEEYAKVEPLLDDEMRARLGPLLARSTQPVARQ